MAENSSSLVTDITQVSPVLAVASCSIAGLPLSDWVYIATLVYTFVGIITMIKKHWFNQEDQEDKEDKEDNNNETL